MPPNKMGSNSDINTIVDPTSLTFEGSPPTCISRENSYNPSSLLSPKISTNLNPLNYYETVEPKRKPSGLSSSSSTSLLSRLSTKSQKSCACCVILAVIVLFITFLVGFTLLYIKFMDLQNKMNELLNNNKESGEFCMPCGDLKIGIFEDDNAQMQFLIRKEVDGSEICCAKTPNQTRTMFDLLFQRKQLQKCKQEMLSEENKYACHNNKSSMVAASNVISAHLVKNTNSGRQPSTNFQPITDWTDQRSNIAHSQGINHEKGVIHVNSTGLYYIYSQVYFVSIFRSNGTNADPRVLHHSIYRYNPNLPNDGNEELVHSARTECWEERRKYTDYTSYTGAAIKLKAGDDLYVKVSDLSLVKRDSTSSFFGLFKIG